MKKMAFVLFMFSLTVISVIVLASESSRYEDYVAPVESLDDGGLVSDESLDDGYIAMELPCNAITPVYTFAIDADELLDIFLSYWHPRSHCDDEFDRMVQRIINARDLGNPIYWSVFHPDQPMNAEEFREHSRYMAERSKRYRSEVQVVPELGYRP